MKKSPHTNIERIIAKIDNDFNPDNSDWIPRVGAWCIDAMSMLDCLPTEKKKIKLQVKDRRAYTSIQLDEDIKVYTCNGCRIKKANEVSQCCKSSVSSTGEHKDTDITFTRSHHINTGINEDKAVIAQTINGSYPEKHNVFIVKEYPDNKNYVIVDKHQLEFNFDIDCIIIEYDGIKTEQSGMCGCEMPVIPNNGLLIEALAYFCMYKMLTRGYKHPVFNLAASQYGTNPYYMWLQLKDQAKRSIINNGFDEDVDKLWRSAFFIQTFDPKN